VSWIPISDFDFIQYRKAHSPPVLGPRNPSAEHVTRAQEPLMGTAAQRDSVMPSYREITEVLGFDLMNASNPVSVDPRALLEVIGRFIRQIDVEANGG